MQVTSLGYIGFESPEFEVWRDFGPRVLGCQVAETAPDGGIRLRVDDRAWRIAVHPGLRNRLGYLGWELPSVEALETAFSELESVGSAPERFDAALCRDRMVRDGISFHDPAGLIHEIFVGQLSKPGTFRPGRPMDGFVTGRQGLGHVVLIVPDEKAALEFYCGVMGFRVSDHVDTGMINLTFLHCNSRHHSLAVTEVPRVRGLQHLMIQVRSIDDVGSALEICNREKVPLLMGFGRHTNDQMLSFYLRTPTGWDLEYGYGAIEIDDEGWIVTTYDAPSVWGHEFLATELSFDALEEIP